ncbi:MAG: Ltp family lipoprotein [Oscillospiraceae bacterium]|nr:Ltp family lipoprotein [Oscillospiraceae bacterium]
MIHRSKLFFLIFTITIILAACTSTSITDDYDATPSPLLTSPPAIEDTLESFTPLVDEISPYYPKFPYVPRFGLLNNIVETRIFLDGDYIVYEYDVSSIDSNYDSGYEYGLLMARFGFVVIDIDEGAVTSTNGDTEMVFIGVDNTVQISLRKISPPVWERLYIDDDYDKYTTPASENGLGGTLLRVEGIVDTEEILESIYLYTVNDGGNEWLITSINTEKMPINIGDSITIFGAYQGVSGVFNDTPIIFVLRLKYADEVYFPLFEDDDLGVMIAATQYEEDQKGNIIPTQTPSVTTPSPTPGTPIPTPTPSATTPTPAPGTPTPTPTPGTTTPTPAPPPSSSVTTSQSNALRKANEYLRIMAFSRDGLVAQLEFDRFTREDAIYGVDNCGADWNEQALKRARDYMKIMPFSHRGLVGQLEHDKFTSTQAKHGADNCGADWNEQAAKKAKTYLDMMAFSRDSLINQLVFDGFTNSQAIYGAEANGY